MNNVMPQQQSQENPQAEMAEKVRRAAQQVLNPQELQIIAASVTPQFIQVMAKLFGDQAVMLLTPLVDLQSQPQQYAPEQSAASPLDNFSAAPSSVRFGRGEGSY